jgi:hypothetical protein
MPQIIALDEFAEVELNVRLLFQHIKFKGFLLISLSENLSCFCGPDCWF